MTLVVEKKTTRYYFTNIEFTKLMQIKGEVEMVRRISDNEKAEDNTLKPYDVEVTVVETVDLNPPKKITQSWKPKKF